jgi:uncharacterized Zn-binding protein involved in type VI secretion
MRAMFRSHPRSSTVPALRRRLLLWSAAALLPAVAQAAPEAAATELPREAHIVYDVLYGSAGMRVGRAEQHWRIEGGRYTLSTELKPIVGSQIRYESSGRLGADGLVPERFAEYRGGNAQPRTHAEFDWPQHQVHYGSDEPLRQAPLSTGAQDVNALPYQLAWLGARAARAMQVVSGRGQSQQRFASAGSATLPLDGQPVALQGWRAVEGPDRTEVWLAPSLANLPLRVRRVDDDKELQFVAREARVER